MPASQNESPISEQLRLAIIESGIPMLRLERETGVARQSVMRFLKGERSLRLDIADKLATYYGLKLIKTRKNRTAADREAK